MKKYGILSLNIYEKDNNWGSILQSYALQECVKSLGYNVQIVDICPKCINKYEAKYPIIRSFPFRVKTLIHSARNSVLNGSVYIRRANKFNTFIDNYYDKTKPLTIKSLEKENFYGFVVGSDIVWNIDFTNGFDELFFCNYSFMTQKNNIAYAPSMCDRLFDSKEGELLIQNLKNFRYISVRELSTANYVSNLTGIEIASTVDPTLLVNSSVYEKFLIPRLIKENYILVYTVPGDEPLAKYADAYAKKNNLKMVRIECLDIRKKEYDCINFSDAGIEEWLTLIKYADMVFTNSFHACIFSIIFKTQFHTVYRNPGKTKIEDLCSQLGIQNYCEKSQAYSFEIDQKIDFSEVYFRLAKLKNKSLSFLKNALEEGKYEG